jgi:hypothetical protein
MRQAPAKKTGRSRARPASKSAVAIPARSPLRDWLRGVEGVADYAPGAANEGGNGVTVARLET